MIGEISEVTITVKGMTCAGCEFNVETGIKKLKGIIRAKADFKQEKVKVRFDKGRVKIEDIIRAINKTGYKIIEP